MNRDKTFILKFNKNTERWVCEDKTLHLSSAHSIHHFSEDDEDLAALIAVADILGFDSSIIAERFGY